VEWREAEFKVFSSKRPQKLLSLNSESIANLKYFAGILVYLCNYIS